ncbi:MAG: uncharacterized protein JWM57_283 [Phycisphaerales bacterium]|nr:uncharacterized protein [Phycisphaerales bacterium]
MSFFQWVPMIASLTMALGSTTVAEAASAVPAPAVDFGPNVILIDPTTPDAQARLDALFAQQERAQFDDRRYAVMLKPGRYDLDIKVGFYTQILGIGRSPDDVSVTGAVRCKADWMNGNATCNFWRAVENLSVTPTLDHGTDVWAVSQATALRRVHVRGNLALWDRGWSSGGYMADCRIDGAVVSGSQQQWFSRNSNWRRWQGGVYNMVFLGAPNAPAGEWPAKPFTTIDATPLIREKPYLTLGSDDSYAIVLPPLGRDTRGTTWPNEKTPGRSLPLSAFYVAHAGRDDAAHLNAALAAGQNLLLTPGVYELSEALRVERPGTVVLGLGYATLRPTRGTAAVAIADVDGVTLAGLLLDAGEIESPELLQVGPPGSRASHAADPTILSDIYARAGGAAAGRCRAFVTINSKDVVGDHFWLWRADHGKGVGWDVNPVANGLVVNGDDVTNYGLFVEHTREYQTLWNANGGRVYFYQSEFPYDPPSQAEWGNDGRGYASYKVADGVTSHSASGLGMYAVFTHAPVVLQNAVEAPDVPGVRLRNMVTTRFAGQPGSGVAHVVNGRGDAAMDAKPVRQ